MDTNERFWSEWIADELHRREKMRRPMEVIWQITQSNMENGMKRYAIASVLNSYFEDFYDYTLKETVKHG